MSKRSYDYDDEYGFETFVDDDDYVDINEIPQMQTRTASQRGGTHPNSSHHRHKKRRKHKLLKSIMCIFGVLLVVFFTLSYTLLSGINYTPLDHNWDDKASDGAPDWELQDSARYFNVLLVGLDGSGSANSRTDTMMIISIDRLTMKMKMASLLRDTYVDIPGKQANRLNAAHVFGGMELTLQTIESNYRLKIDKFISVNFDNFAGIIDTMGGVDIEISSAEANVINTKTKSKGGTGKLKGGMQHLNGAEGLYYARIRKLDSDFGRTERQRKLLKAMISQCKEKDVSTILDIVEKTCPELSTNTSKPALMWFIVQGLAASANDIDQIAIPVKGGYKSQSIRGMAVLVPDLEKNCTELHKFLFGKVPN